MYAKTNIIIARESANTNVTPTVSRSVKKRALAASLALLFGTLASSGAMAGDDSNTGLINAVHPVVVHRNSTLQEVREALRKKAQVISQSQQPRRETVQERSKKLVQAKKTASNPPRKPSASSALELLTGNARANAPALAAARAALAQREETTNLDPARPEQSPWLTEHGLNANGWFLLDVIASTPNFGLEKRRLPHTQLERLGVEPWNEATAAAYNHLLTASFKLLMSDLGSGRVDPRKAQSSWFAKAPKISTKAMLEQLSSGSTDVATLLTPHLINWHRFEPMVEAIDHYKNIEQSGGWVSVPEGEKLLLGSSGFRVEVLKSRLMASGDYTDYHQTVSLQDTASLGLTATNNSEEPTDIEAPAFDIALEAAVMQFQKRHGLVDDGIVGPATLRELNISVGDRVKQMEANLERMRWTPADLGDHHIITNIPNYRMNVVKNNEVVMDMRVVVGKQKHKTPVFSAEMSYLVVNPTWMVPHSIANKELVPKERSNPGHLSNAGFEFLSHNGSEFTRVDPYSIPDSAWQQDKFPYRIRQRSGKRNALGKVKFMLPNPYAIYLHDTPAKSLFKKQNRAYSHGCVRLAEPRKLANYLLHEKGWDDRDIANAFKQNSTKSVNLDKPIPNHIVYQTSWVDDDGSVQFRKDVYNHDPRLIKHLVAEDQQRQDRIQKFNAPVSVLATLE